MDGSRESEHNVQIRQLKHLYSSLNQRDKKIFEKGVYYASVLLGYTSMAELVEDTKIIRDRAIADGDPDVEEIDPDVTYLTAGYSVEDIMDASEGYERGGGEEDDEELEMIENVEFNHDESPEPLGDDDAEGDDDEEMLRRELARSHPHADNLISSSVQKSSPMWDARIHLPNADLTLPTSEFGSPQKYGDEDYVNELSKIVPSKRDVMYRREQEAKQSIRVHPPPKDDDLVTIDGKTYLRHPTKPDFLIPALTMKDIASSKENSVRSRRASESSSSHSTGSRLPNQLTRSASMQVISMAARPALEQRSSLGPAFELHNSASSVSTAESILRLPRYDSASPSNKLSHRIPIPPEINPKLMNPDRYPQWLKVKKNPALIAGKDPDSPLGSDGPSLPKGYVRRSKSMSDVGRKSLQAYTPRNLLAGTKSERTEENEVSEEEKDLGSSPRKGRQVATRAKARKSTSAVEGNEAKAITVLRRKRQSLPAPNEFPVITRLTRSQSRTPQVIIQSVNSCEGKGRRARPQTPPLSTVMEEPEGSRRITRSQAISAASEESNSLKRKGQIVGPGVDAPRKRGRKN